MANHLYKYTERELLNFASGVTGNWGFEMVDNTHHETWYAADSGSTPETGDVSTTLSIDVSSSVANGIYFGWTSGGPNEGIYISFTTSATNIVKANDIVFTRDSYGTVKLQVPNLGSTVYMNILPETHIANVKIKVFKL